MNNQLTIRFFLCASETVFYRNRSSSVSNCRTCLRN